MRAAKNTFARIAPTLLLIAGLAGVTLALTGCGGSNTDAESAAVTKAQSETSVPIDDRATDSRFSLRRRTARLAHRLCLLIIWERLSPRSKSASTWRKSS